MDLQIVDLHVQEIGQLPHDNDQLTTTTTQVKDEQVVENTQPTFSLDDAKASTIKAPLTVCETEK